MNKEITMSSTKSRTAIATGASVAVGPFTLRSRSLAFGLLLVLALQFLVGMVTNVYVTIPATHPGAGTANYFGGLVQGLGWALTDGDWALQLHVLIGLVLLLMSFALIGVAYATRERVWMICAPIGVVSTIGAGFSGASFINDGQGFSSLLMSVWFLIALVALVVGLYLTPRPNQ
jgi:hypothetical protein